MIFIETLLLDGFLATIRTYSRVFDGLCSFEKKRCFLQHFFKKWSMIPECSGIWFWNAFTITMKLFRFRWTIENEYVNILSASRPLRINIEYYIVEYSIIIYNNNINKNITYWCVFWKQYAYTYSRVFEGLGSFEKNTAFLQHFVPKQSMIPECWGIYNSDRLAKKQLNPTDPNTVQEGT